MTTTTRSSSPDIQELERVTIRFAGDSGDGMQLTGTQFTRTAAVFGNDISTLPGLPGRDPRPGRLAARRLRLPDQLPLDRHPHARRPARRPRRDEPGRAQDEHRRPAGRRRPHRQQRRVHAAEPEQGGLRQQPADRRLAQGLHRLRDPDLDAQRALARRARDDDQAEGPDEELLRARAHVLAVRAEHGSDASTGSTRSSRRGRSSPRRTSGRSRPATPSARRPRSFHTHYRVQPAKLPPGTYRNITGNEATALGFLAASQARRPAAVLRLVPDHPGQRHPPPAVGLQDVRGQDLPGRGRDRGHRRGHRRELRRRARADRLVGPGHRAQDRGDGPRGHGRAAARRHRRPARRPVDRHADEERAGRPAPGACSGATPTRRSRSSRRPRRASASTSPSRPGASRSST